MFDFSITPERLCALQVVAESWIDSVFDEICVRVFAKKSKTRQRGEDMCGVGGAVDPSHGVTRKPFDSLKLILQRKSL